LNYFYLAILSVLSNNDRVFEVKIGVLLFDPIVKLVFVGVWKLIDFGDSKLRQPESELSISEEFVEKDFCLTGVV